MKHRDFNQRLAEACDNLSTVVPPYGHGRQVFIARRLKVTQEAVRKWFTGESRPKVGKMKELAALLEVDEAWLSLGVEAELDRREKRVHGEKTEGAIYLLFGMLTMAGGHCAFPGAKDPRAEYVDFYTILRGAQTAVHVAVGREVSKGVFQFNLPSQYHDVKCAGVIHLGGLRVQCIDLRHELVDKHRQRKGGSYAVAMGKKDGGFFTGSDEWPRLHDVGDLI